MKRIILLSISLALLFLFDPLGLALSPAQAQAPDMVSPSCTIVVPISAAGLLVLYAMPVRFILGAALVGVTVADSRPSAKFAAIVRYVAGLSQRLCKKGRP